VAQVLCEHAPWALARLFGVLDVIIATAWLNFLLLNCIKTINLLPYRIKVQSD